MYSTGEYTFIIDFYYAVVGINFKEIELTQCLVFFSVSLSPVKTWPR